MLSRIAGNCLWLARYLERAENTARLIGVAHNQSLMPEFHGGDARPWRWLVDIAADDQALDKLPSHNPADAALELLIWNRDYLEPYDSAFGQLMLGVVGVFFGGAFVWLARSFRPVEEQRFLRTEDVAA